MAATGDDAKGSVVCEVVNCAWSSLNQFVFRHLTGSCLGGGSAQVTHVAFAVERIGGKFEGDFPIPDDALDEYVQRGVDTQPDFNDVGVSTASFW